MNARQLLSSLAFATSLVACAEAAAEPDEAASAAEINHADQFLVTHVPATSFQIIHPSNPNATLAQLVPWGAEMAVAMGSYDAGAAIHIDNQMLPVGCSLVDIHVSYTLYGNTEQLRAEVWDYNHLISLNPIGRHVSTPGVSYGYFDAAFPAAYANNGTSDLWLFFIGTGSTQLVHSADIHVSCS